MNNLPLVGNPARNLRSPEIRSPWTKVGSASVSPVSLHGGKSQWCGMHKPTPFARARGDACMRIKAIGRENDASRNIRRRSRRHFSLKCPKMHKSRSEAAYSPSFVFSNPPELPTGKRRPHAFVHAMHKPAQTACPSSAPVQRLHASRLPPARHNISRVISSTRVK
jgi:hypothetical protein